METSNTADPCLLLTVTDIMDSVV